MIQYDTPSEKQFRFPYVRELVRATRTLSAAASASPAAPFPGPYPVPAPFPVSFAQNVYGADTTLLIYLNTETELQEKRNFKDKDKDKDKGSSGDMQTQSEEEEEEESEDEEEEKDGELEEEDDDNDDDDDDEEESEEEDDDNDDDDDEEEEEEGKTLDLNAVRRPGATAVASLMPVGITQALHPVPYPKYHTHASYAGSPQFKADAIVIDRNIDSDRVSRKQKQTSSSLHNLHCRMVLQAILGGLEGDKSRMDPTALESFSGRSLANLMYAVLAAEATAATAATVTAATAAGPLKSKSSDEGKEKENAGAGVGLGLGVGVGVDGSIDNDGNNNGGNDIDGNGRGLGLGDGDLEKEEGVVWDERTVRAVLARGPLMSAVRVYVEEVAQVFYSWVNGFILGFVNM